MQVQQNQSTDWSQPPEAESVPTTVRGVIECEQYQLSLDGCCTPIVSILISFPSLHLSLLNTMLMLKDDKTDPQDDVGQRDGTTENLPYKAYILFSSFTDVYSCYMFGHNGKMVLENNGQDLLRRAFQVFDTQGYVNQTAAGYLYKILDMVLAKSDATMLFGFLMDNPAIMDNLIYHFQSLAAPSIILKSLETNSSIPMQARLDVVTRVFTGVVAGMKNRPDDALDLVSGLKSFCEKILEKTYIRKVDTGEIADYIMSGEIAGKLKQALNFENIDCETNAIVLDIYSLFLRQYKNKEQLQSKPSVSKAARHFGKCLAKVKVVLPTFESLQTILDTLRQLTGPLIEHNRRSNGKSLSVVHFQFCQTLQYVAIYAPKSIESVVSPQLMRWFLDSIVKYPLNNLFHGCVKEVISVVVKRGDRALGMQNESTLNLYKFICEQFVTRKGSYCGHLFSIIEVIFSYANQQDLQQVITQLNYSTQWKAVVDQYHSMTSNREKIFAQNCDSEEDQTTSEQTPQSMKNIMDTSTKEKTIITSDSHFSFGVMSINSITQITSAPTHQEGTKQTSTSQLLSQQKTEAKELDNGSRLSGDGLGAPRKIEGEY